MKNRLKIQESPSVEYSSFTWPAAFVFKDYILNNLSLFKDKSILEIGAGTGLLSFTLASLNINVTASDVNKESLENLKQNAELNNLNLKIMEINWKNSILNDQYDIIIGSDVFYDDQDFEFIIEFIHKNLKDSGKFITAYQERNMTFSISYLLQKFNLKANLLDSQDSIFLYEIIKV